MGNSCYESLSDSERRVLNLAVAGLTDGQVAVRIGITLGTVRRLWKSIREKLSAVNRLNSVYLAFADSTGTAYRPSSTLLDRQRLHIAGLSIAKVDVAASISSSNEVILKARQAIEASRYAIERARAAAERKRKLASRCLRGRD